MFDKSLRARVATGVVAVGLLAAAGPALAHGGPRDRGVRGAAPVVGTIAAVSGSTVQLTTSTGSVTLTLTAETHVARETVGSRNDLSTGENVDLALTPGTTTVTAVTIEPARSASQGSHPARASHPEGTPRPHPTSVGTPRPKPARTPVTHSAPPAGRAGGQIVSFSGSTLVVSGRKGTSTTYTLTANASVTKIVAATSASLAVNQKVQVMRTASNTAIAILILG